MKNLVLLLALFAISIVQAKTQCVVKASSAKDPSTYDRSLYLGELKGPISLVVERDNSKATVVDLMSPGSYGELAAMDGKRFISISETTAGQLGIASGVVKIRMTENVFPLDALSSSGMPKGNSAVGLYLPSARLSIVCYEI